MSKIVDFAKSKIGLPYTWGGNTDATGYDCSGLTKAAYASVGITIPRVAADQYAQATKIPRNSLKAGDLVFFRTKDGDTAITHTGIYNGDGTFTHAPRTGLTIKIDSLDSPYYSARFAGGGRYTGAAVENVYSDESTIADYGTLPYYATIDDGYDMSIMGRIVLAIAVFVIVVIAMVFFMKSFKII